MYCINCGTQLPDNAQFCYKCGAKTGVQTTTQQAQQSQTSQNDTRDVVAGKEATEIKCPGCGAPIKPVEGQAVATCQYCGTTVTLNVAGWQNVAKHSMLSVNVTDENKIRDIIKRSLDHGLFARHIFEEATEKDMILSYVPYWIVPVSAVSQYKYVSVGAEVATFAIDAAMIGAVADMGGGRGGGFGMGMGDGILGGMMIGGMMGGGMGGGMNNIRGGSFGHNYLMPVCAIKATTFYQPKKFAFKLDERIDFDFSKIPKGIKLLNGDIDEDSSKQMAQAMVSNLQEESIKQQHHHIESINTQCQTGTPEMLHVPIWKVTYETKKEEFDIAIDGNSGMIIRKDEVPVKRNKR